NMSDGTTQTSVPAGNTAVQLNQWNHIAFVRQNGVVTPYLNTIARSTVSSNLDLSWPGGLSFGNYNSYDVAKSFIGELDEVRIFSSSRTAAEINAHSIIPASVNVTVPSFSLVAYYKCNRDNLAILTDEFGASAVLTGDISSSKTQSEAMGCPMAQLATAEALDSFEANWLKPTVITSDATQYTIEYANNPLFSNTGALTSTEVDENDFNVEKFEVDSLPFTQSAYFYQVSTIYDLGVDTNGDGNINDDDLLKRFSKMTALQLEMKMPIPKNAYTQSGTSTLSSDGVSEIHAAVGTALTTSLWFKANVRSNGTDLKDLLRITDTKNTQNRLKIHLDNERIKIQTDNPAEVDNGVVTMEPQRWYALTVVWESTGATVYLDGDVLYSTTVVTLSPGVIDATYVLESDFVGSLDDLKIWNRAFTQQEVKDYMNFEILNPSSHSDLIAYYDFNVARGPYLADLSQNGASLEVTDTGAFEPSYALGCPFALPFEDIDYNKFTVAWNESVDWAIGPVDGTIQTYAYDLDFTSKSPIGTERDAEVINVVANPDGLGKLLYLVTSMETSESEKVALDPTHEYACTINRSIVNPFSGLPEVRHSRNVSSRLRAEAPGECLNLLGSNDHLTLPTTLAGLGTDFTIETWVKFGPPASEPKFSIEISGTNFATRVTSPTTRTFIFDGTADGSPFLGMEWLINDVKYDEYVQDIFDDIEGDHLTGVKYFDLNGNDDPTGSFIKSRSPIDRSDLLMEVVNGTVADDQFGYKDQVALGGRIVAGFKNAANNALSVTNGLLQDFDRELGEDKNGDLSGEVLGHASKHARWFNLVMTYSGNTLKLYVDGFDADLSADPHGTYDPAQTVTRLGEGFNGFIEEFRIWDVAHSFDVLKAQRYSELDIQGVELLDPAEKAAAEAKRIERNGLTDLQYGHLTCYLPFSVSHRSGLANIKNIGSAVGDATLVNGESNALISTLENTVCWPLVDNHGEIIIDPVDGFSSASCRFFPCVRMSYNVRTFNGATTLPDEDNNPSLIKSGMNLTDGNLIPPNSVYTYRTDVNPHQTTHIEGKDIPTRYLSVMWGLADPSLVSKQVTQQSWYLDNSGLPLTENVILPDEDGNPTTYAIPITYEITFDMKAISPEVYDESYTGPNTSGMTDEEKKNVREKFDNLVDSDFQLLWCADDGPIRTSSDVYTDLNALFPVQDPLEPHYTKAQITVSKIGSEGTRAGTAFTVKFSGIPRDIRYSSFDRNLNVKAWNHHHAGYYALGMSVSINDMVLTPVTGLVSDIVVVDGVATVSWSVVTESNVKQYLLEKRGKDGKWHTVSVVNSDGSLNYSLQDPDHAPGDEYRITTIDVNGMRQAFPIGSDALSTAYVTLNTGWNLISFPLNNVDLSDMRDLTVGKYWNWDGSSYQELNDTPKAMEGVWVYSLVNNFPVKVTGVETDQDYLDLTTGWNLKGPRENTYFDDKAITVYTWSNQNQYVKISEAINQITSGHGYWIFNPDLGKQIPLHDLPLN
ncbi:MAG: laminin G domain-containing protein, partial [Lentisphaeria bacterium]|nr:laminin G domain-containing protein [Lentisphaeria bacterium]